MDEDLTTTADADLQRKLEAIRAEQVRRMVEREQEEASLQAQIAASVTTLKNLLGPENATKPTMANLLAGNVSIRELSAFSSAELATHPGLVLRLILDGIEELAVTTRNIAATR